MQEVCNIGTLWTIIEVYEFKVISVEKEHHSRAHKHDIIPIGYVMGIGIFVLEIIIRLVLCLKRKYCPNSIDPILSKVINTRELKSIQINIPDLTKFQENNQNIDDSSQVTTWVESQENILKEELKVESKVKIKAVTNTNITCNDPHPVRPNLCIINVMEQDNNTTDINIESEDYGSNFAEESKTPCELIAEPVKSVRDTGLKLSRNNSNGPKEQLSYSFVIVYIMALFVGAILNLLRFIVHTEVGKTVLIHSIVTITRTILYVLPVLWLYSHEEAYKYSQHKIRQLKTNLT